MDCLLLYYQEIFNISIYIEQNVKLTVGSSLLFFSKTKAKYNRLIAGLCC